ACSREPAPESAAPSQTPAVRPAAPVRRPSPPSAAEALSAARKKTPEQQRELIQNLILDGIFSNIELQEGIPRVYLRPAFRLLTPEEQLSFLAHVYAFAFREQPGNRVLLFDAGSRNPIGEFTEAGLTMN
ncbi:MAG TPA: hypothetical protein VNN17_11160, partial [Terriglobia bacterium]|nr:hypothetical protein [Terriglobia bacterium]